MGLDPASWALIAGMLGSSAIGGITAGDGQELDSFGGNFGIDPRTMMGESKGLLSDILGSLMEDAGSDTTIRTTVNPLPSFHGGALPMAISVPGMDANRLNPALRTTPGLKIPRRTLSGSPYSGGIVREPDDPKDPTVPTQDGYLATGDAGDDGDQAAAALQLLLGGSKKPQNSPYQT